MRRHARKRIWVGVIFALSAYLLAIAFYRHFGDFSKRTKSALQTSYGVETVKAFTFSNPASLREWEEKVFKGKVAYEIASDAGTSCVSAVSEDAATALYYRIKLETKAKHPVVRWKWKAEKFPVKQFEESLDKENEDDFAARFYIIFPAMFITNWHVLEYVWAEKLPVGTIGTSPYSKNIKLIVLRSGKDAEGKWHSEERDIVSDYIKLFGQPPEGNIGAIAFMTNTEHTKGSAEAKYDDIEVGYKLDIKKEGGRTP